MVFGTEISITCTYTYMLSATRDEQVNTKATNPNPNKQTNKHTHKYSQITGKGRPCVERARRPILADALVNLFATVNSLHNRHNCSC